MKQFLQKQRYSKLQNIEFKSNTENTERMNAMNKDINF